MTNKKRTFNRKDFLRIVAAAGAAGMAGKLGWDMAHAPVVVEETRSLMGTVVNLTVIGEDRLSARQAVGACFSRMASLESLLSRFQPGSQLSRLNRDGEIRGADRALIHVLERALSISRQSGGKFDITIKPVLDLYQHVQAETNNLPTRVEIEKALRLVDYQNVHIEGQNVRFVDQEMAVTLDGIAKGYIVDRGVGALRERGFRNVLVEAGGDLAASGGKPGDTPWRIGVIAPRDGEDEFTTRVSVWNQALATSGDYLQSYSEDHKVHHILDPRQGISSPELASVSVLAPSAMSADGYATAVMAMGPEQGLKLIESLPEVEAVLITKSLKTIKSSGFAAFVN